MRAKIGELWIKTYVKDSFGYAIFLKTKSRIRMVHLLNHCSTVEDIYFLGWNCMPGMIGKLWIQTRIATCFWYDIYVDLYTVLVTQKLQVVYECCTYQMTAVLSEISILSVRAGCKIWLLSLAPNTHHSSLGKPFVHAYTQFDNYNLHVVYTTALLSGTFLVWCRVARVIQVES